MSEPAERSLSPALSRHDAELVQATRDETPRMVEHLYGSVRIDGHSYVVQGNTYGSTNISGNAYAHLGDLYDYRHDALVGGFQPKLDRRILTVQNELLMQQSFMENTLSLLVKEAGLDRTAITADEKLEVFIGRPQSVEKIKDFLGESFRPFIKLMESIDARLQALGSYIMQAVGNDSYSPPGSWAKLIDGIDSHAESSTIGRTISITDQPGSWTTLAQSMLGFEEARRVMNVSRILLNLRGADQKFGMLVLRAERLTRIDGISVTNDSSSISSRGTEESDPTASFLTVLMREKEASSYEEYVEALLDTGATADCLSEDLSNKLKLTIQPEEQFIRTAAHGQELSSIGTVKVILRWQDHSRAFSQETIVLSHDFTTKYADTGIWNVCAKADSIFEHIAPFGFGKIKTEDKGAELEAQRKRKEANQRREQADVDAKNAQMEAWVKNVGPVDDGQSQSSLSQKSTRTSSTNTQIS